MDALDTGIYTTPTEVPNASVVDQDRFLTWVANRWEKMTYAEREAFLASLPDGRRLTYRQAFTTWAPLAWHRFDNQRTAARADQTRQLRSQARKAKNQTKREASWPVRDEAALLADMKAKLVAYTAARRDIVNDVKRSDPDFAQFHRFEDIACQRFESRLRRGKILRYSAQTIIGRMTDDDEEAELANAYEGEFAVDNDGAKLWAMTVMTRHAAMLGCRRGPDGGLRDFFETRDQSRKTEPTPVAKPVYVNADGTILVGY